MWSSWFLGNRDPRNDASLLLVIHIEHPTTRSEGFEPPGLLHPSVFKTDALGHSANFSSNIIIPDFGWKSTIFYNVVLLGLGGGVGIPVGLSGGVTGVTTGASL